ncbi:hypothetical protein ACP4OV_011999 [Aristida adscensionis]
MKFGLWKHMGLSTHLTPLLQGLCSDGLWKYAVFWSLESERGGILTWGDGYVNKLAEDRKMGYLCADPNCSKIQTVSSSCCNKSYPFCLVEAELLRMSSCSYSLGEQVIGTVALTGQYCWISANELCSTSAYKNLEDWHLQFAAGIKTVLLVPVIPHGVLQLGSLDMVHESSELVALIKELFHKHYDASASHNSLATGSGCSYTLRQHTETLSIDPSDILHHDLIDVMESSAQLLTVDHLSLPHPFSMSEFAILQDATIGANRTILSDWLSEPLNVNGTLEYENLDGFTLTLTDMANGYAEHTNGTAVVNHDMISSSSVHPDFHKDPGSMSREEHESFTWHSRLKQQGPTNENNADLSLQLETNNYAEQLLDSIINHIGHTSNSESSRSTDSPFSCETHVIKEDRASKMDESLAPDLQGGQELSPISKNEGFISSAMLKNKTTEQCIGHTVRDMDINSVEVKKGCRNIELQRPRPRDRQLIQDRTKELRELIPNTSKCSIDALLEKTISYMLFLQSVHEKAEKIHNTLDKEDSRDEMKIQNGSCPLRVEELDQPGHLLIEMLCGDYEMFLEIAHVFKGLQVSILKGVLEYRSDKLWARFTRSQPDADSVLTDASLAQEMKDLCLPAILEMLELGWMTLCTEVAMRLIASELCIIRTLVW